MTLRLRPGLRPSQGLPAGFHDGASCMNSSPVDIAYAHSANRILRSVDHAYLPGSTHLPYRCDERMLCGSAEPNPCRSDDPNRCTVTCAAALPMSPACRGCTALGTAYFIPMC